MALPAAMTRMAGGERAAPGDALRPQDRRPRQALRIIAHKRRGPLIVALIERQITRLLPALLVLRADPTAPAQPRLSRTLARCLPTRDAFIRPGPQPHAGRLTVREFRAGRLQRAPDGISHIRRQRLAAFQARDHGRRHARKGGEIAYGEAEPRTGHSALRRRHHHNLALPVTAPQPTMATILAARPRRRADIFGPHALQPVRSSRVPLAMTATPEIDIWRTAQILVRKHGSGAPARAEQRANEFFDMDDPDGWALWTRIASAAAELLRQKPRPGEPLN